MDSFVRPEGLAQFRTQLLSSLFSDVPHVHATIEQHSRLLPESTQQPTHLHSFHARIAIHTPRHIGSSVHLYFPPGHALSLTPHSPTLASFNKVSKSSKF